MLESLLISLLSTGVTKGLKLGRDKFEEATLEREFSEDIDIIATEFNRSLRDEVVAAAETTASIDATELEQRWGGVAEALGDMEAIYFDSEEEAVARISDAIVEELDITTDGGDVEPAIQRAVAESYTDAVDRFHDRVSGTEMASQLGLESAEQLRKELREVQSRLSTLQRRLDQEYYDLYDSSEADRAVDDVTDWFPDIPYYDYRRHPTPTATGHDRLLFTGTKGVGKTRRLVRAIRQRDDYEQLLIPGEGLERASDIDPVAEQLAGDLLLVWDDIHEVSRRRDTWLFQAVVERLADLVTEQGYSLAVVATAREDSLPELPGHLDDPEGFWQPFHREQVPSLAEATAEHGFVIEHLCDHYGVDIDRIEATTEAMSRLQEGRYDPEFLYLVAAYQSEFDDPIPESDLPVESTRIWSHRYDEVRDRSTEQRLVIDAIATLTALDIEPYYPLVEGLYREVYGQDAIQDRFRPHVETLVEQGWFTLEHDADAASGAPGLPQEDATLQRAAIRLPTQQQVAPDPSRRVLEAVSEFLRTRAEEYLPDTAAGGRIPTLDVIDGQLPFEYDPSLPIWYHHRYLQYLLGAAPDLYDELAPAHIEAMADVATDPARIRAIYGRQLWHRGQYETAETYLRPVVESSTADEYPTAFGLYGITRWVDERDSRGIVHIREAVKPEQLDDPRRPHTLEVNVHLHCGDILRQGDEYDDALAVYRQAQHLNTDDDPIVEAKIGATLAALDRASEARERFEDALRRHPTSVPLHREYGQFLCQKAAYEEAIPHLETAADEATEPTQLYYLLAEAYEGTGDLQQAADWFERARQEEAELADGRASYVRFLLEQDRVDEARTIAEEGLEAPGIPSVPFVEAVADACAANEAPELAVEFLAPVARSAFHADHLDQGGKLTRRILEIAHEHGLEETFDRWADLGMQSAPADSQARGEVLNGTILGEAPDWRADRGDERAMLRTMFADRHIIDGQYSVAIPLLSAVWDDAHQEEEPALDDLYRLNAGPMLAALSVFTDLDVEPAAVASTLDGETHRLRAETRTLLQAAQGESVDRSPEDIAEESDLTHEDITPLASPTERADQYEGDVRQLACAELLHQILWERG